MEPMTIVGQSHDHDGEAILDAFIQVHDNNNRQPLAYSTQMENIYIRVEMFHLLLRKPFAKFPLFVRTPRAKTQHSLCFLHPSMVLAVNTLD